MTHECSRDWHCLPAYEDNSINEVVCGYIFFLKYKRSFSLIYYSVHTVESANVKQCVDIRIYILKFHFVSFSH